MIERKIALYLKDDIYISQDILNSEDIVQESINYYHNKE